MMFSGFHINALYFQNKYSYKPWKPTPKKIKKDLAYFREKMFKELIAAYNYKQLVILLRSCNQTFIVDDEQILYLLNKHLNGNCPTNYKESVTKYVLYHFHKSE